VSRGFEEEVAEGDPQAIKSISWSFADSPAFSRKSRYGPKGFSMSVRGVLKSMAKHWGLEEDDIEFRALGTFTYVKEWMHTVLICPKAGKGSV
jgi:hypothetical protein